jgi:OFA family oxalate/formate antiporter-like MFS transporter
VWQQGKEHLVATATAVVPQTEREQLLQNRWLILLFSIISMVAVANLQYGWTFFVPSIQKAFGTTTALVQVTFTVFVLLETWLVPFEGYLVDRFGPRNLVLAGAVFSAAGWIGAGLVSDLTSLYLVYALAGIGAGIVYGTAIGNALKWFPDHRGLAAGLTAAGFGAGSALTVAPIADMIAGTGYQATFIQWGIIQGAVVFVAAWFLRAPPQGWLPRTWTLEARALELKKRQTGLDFHPSQIGSTSNFWLLYLMMTLVATGGLMATAALVPMAIEFKVDKIPVSFLWVLLPAATFAASLDRVVNGFCRPMWGWISDRIGRENTMTIAFGLEAVAIFLLTKFGPSNPVLFVVFTGLTFFGWGEIYSLMPATIGDYFGRKYATTNYGFLYTAKGTASVFVPIGAALAVGSVFDFRADILLLIGGLLVVYTLYLGPTVLKQTISRTARRALFVIGGVAILYGLGLTVWPTQLPPTGTLNFTVPAIGYQGVFAVAAVFDVIASLLAFFVLRRMKIPAGGERPSVATAMSAARAATPAD